MGVYIKGMEIPMCCAECEIEGHYEDSYGDEFGFFCPFGYKAYTSETRDAKRLDNCPLIEIPPHGRLIDADAILGKINAIIYAHPDEADLYEEDAVIIRDWLRSEPTVIESEEA